MLTLDSLTASADIVDDLRSLPFDFDLVQFDRDCSWITIDPPATMRAIAGDYNGGSYIACGDQPVAERTILHSSSEGITAQLAPNLSDLIGLLIVLPNWSGIAKNSRGGDLATMREEAMRNEPELLDYFPDWPATRDRIASALNLLLPEDPIERLHASIRNGESLSILVNGEKSPTPFC